MNFNKKYIIDDGSFSIAFNGVSKKNNVDEKNIKDFANKYLSRKPKINNEKCFIEEVINIFRDFDESELSITITNSKKRIFVKYKNFNLDEYQLIEKKNDNEYLEVNYRDENGIDIKYNDQKAQKQDPNLRFHIQYYLNDVLGEISDLNYIKPKFITIEQQILIKIYKYFYKKMPDFFSVDIEKEFQTMMYILNKYSINLEEKYNFDFSYKEPRSYYIHKLLNGLYLSKTSLKNVINNKNNEPDNKTLIELIGKEVNEYLKQFGEEERINGLTKICTFMHTQKYIMNNYLQNDDIIEQLERNSSDDDMSNTIKLFQKINNSKKRN